MVSKICYFYKIYNEKSPNYLFQLMHLRLRQGLSHLCYHKFKCNFQDSLNPHCNCGLNVESTSHYILHCPLFADERNTFMDNIKSVNHKFLEQIDSTLTRTLLFGNPASSVETNSQCSNSMFYLSKDLRKLPCKTMRIVFNDFYSLLLQIVIYFHILFSF